MKIFIKSTFLVIILISNDIRAEVNHPGAEYMENEIKDLIVKSSWGGYDANIVEIISIKENSYDEINDDLINSSGKIELIKINARFSATRNKRKPATSNPGLYKILENCTKSSKFLYIYCGVPAGHIFEGEIELFAVKTSIGHSDTGYALICSNCKRRSNYMLDGYLVLGDRKKEGYVWPPE